MVADVHRTLFSGGVFCYPADTKDPGKPKGKLRLLYEAMPMAYVIEQAGGYASTGRGPILDVTPQSLHERTPVYVGNREVVAKAEEFIAKYDR
jgi:fructose-1,6-bisphosphatase